MDFLSAIVRALIMVCCVVLAVWLVIWVLGELGLALPAMVVKILWLIAVLLIILFLVRTLWPAVSSRWPFS
jgi:hypothetical protein